MAVYRPIPTCPYCGKPIAKAIYEDQSHVPSFLRKIGDTFIRWEYHECDCSGAQKARKKFKDAMGKIDWERVFAEMKAKQDRIARENNKQNKKKRKENGAK